MSIRAFATVLEPFLNFPYIRRTRRNHGLEHATIHVLSSRAHPVSLSGRSDAEGFVLIGDATTEQVERAVHDALGRMRNGEHQLAVHPNCGTGFLTSAALVCLTALVGSVGVRRGARDYIGRLPMVMMMSVMALIVAQPLGLSLQAHITTLGDPGDLKITSVRRLEMRLPFTSRGVTVHRVTTTAG
ncbi:MAG: DUF6391 domain-containing protein [Aggregatilineales bacterium]